MKNLVIAVLIILAFTIWISRVSALPESKINNVFPVNQTRMSEYLPKPHTCANPGPASAISANPDKALYSVGQVAKIIISVLDNKGCPTNQKVNIQSYYIGHDTPLLVDQRSVFPQNSSLYGFGALYLLPLNELGKYRIASTTASSPPITAENLIQVNDVFQTRYATVLYFGLSSFVGLMILISFGHSLDFTVSEVLRFILITGITFSVIGSFIFINDEIGSYAGIGMVKESSNLPNSLVSTNSTNEWVINIGGIPLPSSGAYTTGIQIPIFVFIFGIAGGYLRYLYKTAKIGTFEKETQKLKNEANKVFQLEVEPLIKKLEEERKTVSNNLKKLEAERKKLSKNPKFKNIASDDEISCAQQIRSISYRIEELNMRLDRNYRTRYRYLIFYRSIEDLSLLFLSPLLAIAVWFLLDQWQTTASNIKTLIVVSFTVGLMTDEIVRVLISLTQSLLRSSQKQETEAPTKRNQSKS
jgi:hypothetical protein